MEGETQENAATVTTNASYVRKRPSATRNQINKRQLEPPVKLKLDIETAQATAGTSGLTPGLNDVSLAFCQTDSQASATASCEEFTEVVGSKRHKSPNKFLIDISPETLRRSSSTVTDFSDRQLLEQYSRSESKQFIEDVPRTYQDPSTDFKGDNMCKGFERAYIPQARTPLTPMCSITGFHEYLLYKTLSLKNNPSFVCTASTLRLLMCACYEKDEVRDWQIYAKRSSDGVWYMSESWKDYNDGVPNDMKYAAYVFELLMTGETRKTAAQQARKVFKHKATYQAWLSSLGEYSLLYSGEVDSRDKNGDTVEIKTTTHWTPATGGNITIDPPVLRRSWAQAHLMGSVKISVGCFKRDRDAIKMIDTKEIHTDSVSSESSAQWSTQICIACLHKILNCFKKETFFKDDETYKLKLDRTTKKITATVSPKEFPIDVETVRFSIAQ